MSSCYKGSFSGGEEQIIIQARYETFEAVYLNISISYDFTPL